LDVVRSPLQLSSVLHEAVQGALRFAPRGGLGSQRKPGSQHALNDAADRVTAKAWLAFDVATHRRSVVATCQAHCRNFL